MVRPKGALGDIFVKRSFTNFFYSISTCTIFQLNKILSVCFLVGLCILLLYILNFIGHTHRRHTCIIPLKGLTHEISAEQVKIPQNLWIATILRDVNIAKRMLDVLYWIYGNNTRCYLKNEISSIIEFRFIWMLFYPENYNEMGLLKDSSSKCYLLHIWLFLINSFRFSFSFDSYLQHSHAECFGARWLLCSRWICKFHNSICELKNLGLLKFYG